MSERITDEIMSVMADVHTKLEALKVRDVQISIHRGYGSTDPWLVTYSIGSYGDDDKCKGDDFVAVVNEYARRKGWTEAHKPMVLIGTAPAPEDINAE